MACSFKTVLRIKISLTFQDFIVSNDDSWLLAQEHSTHGPILFGEVDDDVGEASSFAEVRQTSDDGQFRRPGWKLIWFLGALVSKVGQENEEDDVEEHFVGPLTAWMQHLQLKLESDCCCSLGGGG